MPPLGENPLARFAHAVVGEDGFSLGIPRLSDDGTRVIVPVLRTEPARRSFELGAEASDEVAATDVGRVDRLQVRNESATRVFLPPGTLFEGRGTASRGTCAGIVLEPGAVREVRVRCVQAERPIRKGAHLRLVVGLAPLPLAQALLSLDQGLVWATAGARDPATTDVGGSGVALGPSACGMVLMDADGVVAAEICRDPASWQTISRAWQPVDDAPSRLALNPAGAARIAREFLERLPRRAYHAGTADGAVAVDGSVAWTGLDGEVVHVIAFGRDLRPGEPGPMPAGERGDAAWEPPALDAAAGGVVGSVDSEVAVAELAQSGPAVPEELPAAAARPRHRKVLTSGWDSATFQSLERFTQKEFRGDRSAAIRFLVRNELRQRGYMGPRPSVQPSPDVAAEEAGPSPAAERGRATMETRIHDLERIAETEAYAVWLRVRARGELERLAATESEESLRSAAQAAFSRLTPEAVPEELPPSEDVEPEDMAVGSVSAPPPLPPVDVRPLLRRAFAASAGGRYPEALTLFDEALLAEPENRTALLGRAVALRRSGKAQEALDALDLVLRAEPANVAALLTRGRLLQERGDLEGALGAFDVLVGIAPNDWDVWMARGEVLARMGRTKEALQALSEALRRNPDDADIQNRIRGLEAARSAPPPAVPRVPLPRDLQEGQSYVVQERRPDLSLRILRALLARAVPSLLITHQPAARVRGESGLAGARILELSHAPGEGRQDPSALVGLTQAVEHFVRENHGRGVVLLDGVAPLVLENGPRETILFIERVHETVLQSHAIFLVSLAPGDLGDRDVALLERSLRVIA